MDEAVTASLMDTTLGQEVECWDIGWVPAWVATIKDERWIFTLVKHVKSTEKEEEMTGEREESESSPVKYFQYLQFIFISTKLQNL